MIQRKQINDWCADIVQKFHPEKVVLFGSCANGEGTEDSDVDLLVVMPFEGRSLEQAVQVRMDTRPAFPVDLIVRTPEMIASGFAWAIRLFVKFWRRGAFYMKSLTREWIEKAEGDFVTMERESRVRKNPNPDAVCFHA